jgi:hypothetical protein
VEHENENEFENPDMLENKEYRDTTGCVKICFDDGEINDSFDDDGGSEGEVLKIIGHFLLNLNNNESTDDNIKSKLNI